MKAAFSSFQSIDRSIREGHSKEAQKEILLLTSRKVPRDLVVPVAALARRCGLPAVGIRLLNPIVRPHPKAPMVATPEETAEYAECLTKIGASDEATRLLADLDPAKFPQVLLFRASALISQWSYAESIPLLQRYVKLPQLDPYSRQVGKVNLAAALVYERKFPKATMLLRELIYESSLRHWGLLLGNALELGAQNFVLQRKWPDAQKCLAKAESLLKDSDSLDEFFVRKWKAIVHFEKATAKKKPLGLLVEVRDEAKARGHWETMRQCDRFLSLATDDEGLLLHLYFGTPYESYRKRLLQDFGSRVKIPAAYVWRIKGLAVPLLPDLLGGEKGVKVGQLLHRVLSALASDFYRPIRVATLYSRIYPGEYFNPVSSPARVHEGVKRLRQWFKGHRIPLAIEEKAGAYFLQAKAPCGLTVHHWETQQRHRVVIEKLRLKFSNQTFSIRDACRWLKSPARTTLRLLEEAIAAGQLQRVGRGRSTKYTII